MTLNENKSNLKMEKKWNLKYVIMASPVNVKLYSKRKYLVSVIKRTLACLNHKCNHTPDVVSVFLSALALFYICFDSRINIVLIQM